MSKVMSICKKYYLDVIVIQLFFLLLCMQKSKIQYETNDDFYMSGLLYGTIGKPTDHLVFINILIGRALLGLVNTIPTVNWYFCFHILCYLLSFVTLGILIKRRNAGIYWITLPILLWFAVKECYWNVQFTKTSGLLAVAGTLTLIDRFESSGNSLFREIYGGALILLSCLIRMHSTIMVCGIFMFFVLGELFRNGRFRFRVLAVWGIIGAACLSGAAYNAFVYRSEADWRYYWEFNARRTIILDWDYRSPFIYDPENVNEYLTQYQEECNRAGIDLTDMNMLRNTVNSDTEVFDLSFLEKAIAVKSAMMDTFLKSASYMKGFFLSMLDKLCEEPLLYVLLGLAAIWTWSFRNHKLAVAGIPFMLLLGYWYCVFVVRVWPHRLLFSLLCASIYLFIYMICDTAEINKAIILKRVIPLLLAGCVCAAIVQLRDFNQDKEHSALTVSEKRDDISCPETIRRMNAQDNTLYLYGLMDDKFYALNDARALMKEGSYRNYYPDGGWLINMPVLADNLQEHHIVNPWHDCIDRRNIYFIDKNNCENKVEFICNHYDPNVKAQAIMDYSGMTIYGIQTEDVLEDLSLYRTDLSGITCQAEALRKENGVEIKGFVHKEGADPFEQRVYIRVQTEDGSDEDYTAVLTENWDYPPEKDEHYCNFRCELDRSDLSTDGFNVYLYLKTTELYRINITQEISSCLE